MKSKSYLFMGIFMFVLGFIALFKKNDLYIVDFLAGLINLVIFYCDNKKRDKNIPNLERTKEKLTKAHTQGWLSGLDFSILMQDLLISKNGYVIDTGNYECVNAEVALRLADRIKKHPIIWKILFMVA